VYDLVLARKLLTQEQLDQILQPEVLTQPRALSITSVPGKAEVAIVRPSQID
jgi:aspartate ammonia-lyase